MKSQLVFQEKTEMERLRVQNSLLSCYEAPVFAQIFSERQNIAVLDIGCNDGTKTVERFSSDAVSRVIGLEYNEELAQKAHKKYGNEKFSFYHVDVETEDFSKRLCEILKEKQIKNFDVIYLSFLLMHLSDVNKLLTALRPFLKTDGNLFVIEPNDSASTLNNDPNGLLGDFLRILDKDKYSGHREVGANICETLSACGYENIIVWHDAISAGYGEMEKKKAIFTTFFSYLPEDIRLLLDTEPENIEYKSWSEWLDRNYETLRNLILQEKSVISMGMKILTCTTRRCMMYTFTIPNQGTFFLAPLSTEEISEARSLCDECVGENLYGEEEIAATIGASDSFFYFLKNEQGEKVGYIYFYLTDEEYIANYAKLDVELLRAVYAQPNKKVGKIQSVGLKEKYRGMGLATQMILFILNELKKLCIDITFIVCWKPGGTVPLGKTLSECRFSYLTEAKKVWYDDTELICPYCKGRCLCDAEVYYKLL